LIVSERENEFDGPAFGGNLGDESAVSEGGQGGKGEADRKPAQTDADRAKEKEREMEESGEESSG
jgi:hypothetical protein